MKTLLLSEPMHNDGYELLAGRDDIRVLKADGDEDKFREYMPEADGIVVRVLTLDRSLLELATNLKVVSRHGVGCDNIDVPYLSARKIPVAIAVDSNSISVVEHTLMMMLALNKRLVQYDGLSRAGDFQSRSKHYTSELYDKHILIVGYGRIGRRLAPVCRAFGMRVSVADIHLDRELAQQQGCEAVENWRDILPTVDYLSVHVPLDDSTRNLLSDAELDALPSHAIVINCARGGIIDEKALADRVTAGTIAATGSDVFAVEPPALDNPLLQLPKHLSVVTPHNAAGTIESQARMARYSVQNALDGLDGTLGAEWLFNSTAFL